MNETAVSGGRADAAAPAVADAAVPLVIDLDGTLLLGDVLHESTLKLLGEHPVLLFALPGWLLAGKATLKRRIADRVDLHVDGLPVNDELLAWVAAQRASGRRTVLCSASDGKYVRQIAARLNLFDEVIAGDGQVNLSGQAKAKALVERFGERGFDYAGNSRHDVAVWKRARRAIVVSASAATLRSARASARVEREFVTPRPGFKAWLQAIRLHQWAKNLLVFLPLIGGHRLNEIGLLFDGLLAFVAFGLCASSVYIVNDLIDLESDRRHRRKRLRPFASGALGATEGIAASAALLVSAFAIGAFTQPAFDAWLALYYVVTLAYTFVLKRKILVDALALAGLYTLRILGGGAAVDIWPGFWMLSLSLFLFLSLAFVKRYSELHQVLRDGRDSTHGRDYRTGDLPLVETFGVASAFAAVMVMALYLNSASIARLYVHQEIVWLTVPILLYWVTRVWVKAHRGELHDDPVVFAMTDSVSQLSIAAFIMVMVAAAFRW